MSEMRSRIILQSDKERGVTPYDRKKDEAWNQYVETAQKRGEEDTITQFRFFIFVLRCYMSMVKEYVSATKDLVNEINDISEEVNSLVEMDLRSTERFTYNIEKYPRFMRGFVMRRRAKRYYRDKLEILRTKIAIATGSISNVPAVMKEVITGMNSMMTGMTKSLKMIPTTGGKKNASFLPPEITAEIEKRRNGGNGGSGSNPPAGGASAGSEGAGSAPASGAGSSSSGDQWGDDIL